jgi:hypothetical protein
LVSLAATWFTSLATDSFTAVAAAAAAAAADDESVTAISLQGSEALTLWQFSGLQLSLRFCAATTVGMYLNRQNATPLSVQGRMN